MLGPLWGRACLPDNHPAGVAASSTVRYALRRRSPGAFVRERLARLGVPFVVGMVALVPPTWYLQQLRRPDFHEPYWRFWLLLFGMKAVGSDGDSSALSRRSTPRRPTLSAAPRQEDPWPCRSAS